MHHARKDGGFLVLVGDLSVGKTRLLYETARVVLPDFAVLRPDLGDGDLVNSIAAATFPLPKLIVWLEELQRFLDGPGPITAAAVRRLLDAPTPVVLLGAMWPEHANRLCATEFAPDTSQQRPLYPAAADILGDGRVRQEVLISFSRAEREAAAQLASKDPRLATALADRDYNVTEVLAGAPQLVARYKRATEEQRAVLNAAIDARRLGVQAMLTDTLLCAAARGYLSTLHPDDTWFPPALTELTQRDRRQDHATAPLIEVLNEKKSEILGYAVADYLFQHVSRERRYIRVPASTWEAILGHLRDPADAARLASSAADRLLYCYAIPLYRRAADAGDGEAAKRLADLLYERGDLDGAEQVLRAPADAGDRNAIWQLGDLLRERGDLDGLRNRADGGDRYAAEQLANLLRERGDLDELRARADAGDEDAAWQLERLLRGRGDLDGIEQILRARADAGDRNAASRLADLLRERGDLDGLRSRADAGDRYAAWQLARVLRERGDLDDAEQVLRARADAGDRFCAGRLADLLRERGDLDGLRSRADADDTSAARRLAGMLRERGDLDDAEQVLRAATGVGDRFAAEQLAELLRERGDLDGLRARADAGDSSAAILLANLLRERGDQDRAEQVRMQPGGNDADPLDKDGDVDQLRARADVGDIHASWKLAELLRKHGDLDGAEQAMGAVADAGIADAAGMLAGWLRERGDLDQLRARADAGDRYAIYGLAQLLHERGDVDGLRAQVDAGDRAAAGPLADLLAEQGRDEEAERLHRFGLNPDGSIAGP